MRNGLYFFDPASGRFDPILDPEADRPENRFNDGKPDRQGRFWPGSMYEGDTPTPSGALYRLDPDLSCHRMVTGITCSNGLAWSPDSKVMYYADSPAKRVWAWDFDPATGRDRKPPHLHRHHAPSTALRTAPPSTWREPTG